MVVASIHFMPRVRNNTPTVTRSIQTNKIMKQSFNKIWQSKHTGSLVSKSSLWPTEYAITANVLPVKCPELQMVQTYVLPLPTEVHPSRFSLCISYSSRFPVWHTIPQSTDPYSCLWNRSPVLFHHCFPIHWKTCFVSATGVKFCLYQPDDFSQYSEMNSSYM